MPAESDRESRGQSQRVRKEADPIAGVAGLSLATVHARRQRRAQDAALPGEREAQRKRGAAVRSHAQADRPILPKSRQHAANIQN